MKKRVHEMVLRKKVLLSDFDFKDVTFRFVEGEFPEDKLKGKETREETIRIRENETVAGRRDGRQRRRELRR